jgi:hypothetical protein
MGGLGYEFTETTSVVIGYRAMSVDYSNDGFVFDVVQQDQNEKAGAHAEVNSR